MELSEVEPMLDDTTAANQHQERLDEFDGLFTLVDTDQSGAISTDELDVFFAAVPHPLVKSTYTLLLRHGCKEAGVVSRSDWRAYGLKLGQANILIGTLPILKEACQKLQTASAVNKSSAVAVVPTDEVAVDGEVEGVASPQDEFAGTSGEILSGDAEDNSAVLLKRTPAAMLATKLEAVLLFLQVSSLLFSQAGIPWPHVVFPELAFLAQLLAVFNLKLDLGFVDVPAEVTFFANAVLIVFLLPLLIWYLSSRLWRDMVQWRETYIEQWDSTYHNALHYTLGINVLVAAVAMSLPDALVRVTKTVYFICLCLSMGGFFSFYIVASFLRAIYKTRAEGSEQVEFFLWLRDSIQKVCFVFLLGEGSCFNFTFFFCFLSSDTSPVCSQWRTSLLCRHHST
jgi:hypothetical protein